MTGFWDTSAIIPVLLRESWTNAVRSVLEEDAHMAVWWGARVEVVSALARRQREGTLDPERYKQSFERLAGLAASWTEIQPSARVRTEAERVLGIHTLTAADSLQLASALVWSEDEPNGRPFVCLDERLREAARREGFSLLPVD